MTLPYSDPSNPALPSPLFNDVAAARGDHLRANNAAIFGDLTALDAAVTALVDDVADALQETQARVRQTIRTGGVDASNRANFIATEAGLAATLQASPAVPVVATWANGNDALPQNYFSRFIANRSWTGLTAYGRPKLYLDRDGAGVVTQGHSMYSPQYGAQWRAGLESGALHAHFDGADGAITHTDVFNNVWTCAATGAIKTTEKKFGTASFRSAAIGDYIETPAPVVPTKWTIEFWFRRDDMTAGSVAIFAMENIAGLGINVSANNAGSNKIGLYLSSDGSTWDVANASLGSKTAWSNNVWYHFALVFDGATYKTYVNGVLDCTVTSSAIVCPCSYINLGTFGPSHLNGDQGYWDEFRFTPYAKYTAAFTPSAVAFTPETQHWFDTFAMKMKYGYPGSWTECWRLFVGECDTAAAASNGLAYAINGEYESDLTTWAINNVYSFDHNIGDIRVKNEVFIRIDRTENGLVSTMIYNLNEMSYADYSANTQGHTVYMNGPLNVKLAIALLSAVDMASTMGLSVTAYSNKLILKSTRSW